jgi:uncharacterized membrane protein YphA (DoxX/SURF4 family)
MTQPYVNTLPSVLPRTSNLSQHTMTKLDTFTASSRNRLIAYWVTTGLVAFQLGTGGAGDILRPASLVEGMAHLGYPAYFCVILGIWKVLGAVAVLAPRLPRLKEWAYAGTVFDLTGAAASHLAVGDSAIKLLGPLIFTGFACASWALRPPARRLQVGHYEGDACTRSL